MIPRTLAIHSYRSQGLWVATDLRSKDDLRSSIVRSSWFTWCYQHSSGWAAPDCIKSCRLSAAKRHRHQSMYSNMHEKCVETLSWSHLMAMYIILSLIVFFAFEAKLVNGCHDLLIYQQTQKQPSLAGSRPWILLVWLDSLWNLPYFVKIKKLTICHIWTSHDCMRKRVKYEILPIVTSDFEYLRVQLQAV